MGRKRSVEPREVVVRLRTSMVVRKPDGTLVSYAPGDTVTVDANTAARMKKKFLVEDE